MAGRPFHTYPRGIDPPDADDWVLAEKAPDASDGQHGPHRYQVGELTAGLPALATADEHVIAGASMFPFTGSTSAVGAVGGASAGFLWEAMLFDGTTAEQAVAPPIVIPAHWDGETYSVYADVVNASSGTGTYALKLARSARAVGESLNFRDNLTASVVTTAAAEDVLQSVTLETGIAAVAGDRLNLTVLRVPADDTLTNDIGLVGLRVVKDPT